MAADMSEYGGNGTGTGFLSPQERRLARSDLLARNWWALALRGVAALIFGVFALLMPGVTIVSLVWLFAAYLLVDGVFAIIAGLRAASHHERWVALILEGVLDLVAAAIAFFWPGVTLIVLLWFAAFWAIVTGVLMVAAAIRLHLSHGRVLLGIAGAVSVLWGLLLLIFPAAGIVVLTWWFGAYAILFGCALLALAFRLRSRRAALLVG